MCLMLIKLSQWMAILTSRLRWLLAKLWLSMYPTSIISPKAEINGGQFLNNAIAPRLSGKNAAPVIIQTTQAVKGITS
jgi:hypothetical protein